MSSDPRRAQIQQRLNEVFRQVFDDDNLQIHDSMTAKDIDEWDSLMHITLVISVEKEFGIRMNSAEVGKLENVGAMIGLIEKRLAS